DHEAGRLRRDRVSHLRAECLEPRLRVVAGEALERAGDDVRAAGERAFARPLFLPGLEAKAEPAQLLYERSVLRVREPLGHRLGPVGAEALDLGDLLRRRGDERVDVEEVAREILREHPADAGDVEPEQHARERHPLPRRLDLLDCVGGRDLTEAVELEQLLLAEAVEVGQRADERLLPQRPDGLLPDAVDVGRPFDPGDQRLEAARRTGPVRAAVHRLALRLHDLRAAERAVGRHPELLGAAAVRPGRADDLRDDVAGPLDDHVVAHADAPAVDVLLVVQRGAGDGHAADLDWLAQTPPAAGPAAADADHDLLQS